MSLGLTNSKQAVTYHQVTKVRRSTDIRKNELVAAALELVGSRGIKALTTRSLAERVGLSSGAIFKHFASLESLLIGVAEHIAQVLSSTMPDASVDPVARLDQFVELRSRAVGAQVGILRLMLSEQFHLALPEAASVILTGCVQETRRFVTRCIEEGQESGLIRADLNGSALATIVIGTVQMLAVSPAIPSRRTRQSKEVRMTLAAMLAPQSIQTAVSTASTVRRKPR